ncbi:MAG: Gp15 family bacteriophage protein [Sporomusa sp.]
MIAWDLPTTLEVGGKAYEIRTDFRAIIDILIAFNDPELESFIRPQVMLEIIYVDYESIPDQDIEEAVKKAMDFIDCGMKEDANKPKPRTMDWEQDAPLIIPAINRVAGKEIRASEYMHWWTFMGCYMEIHECTFSQIVSIRTKKAKGKKLEKYEQEYFKENKELIILKHPLSEEDERAKEELLNLLGR